MFPFIIEPGDIMRFGTFYNLNARHYRINTVTDPIITIVNSNPSVISPLRLTFDSLINVNEISTTAFAILRKSPDETCVILDYNKFPGETSQGLLSSQDLRKDIADDESNIIIPIRNQILLDQ